MSLSGQLKKYHESGDFADALDGLPERAAALEQQAAARYMTDDQATKLRDCFVQHQKGAAMSAQLAAANYVASDADSDRAASKHYLADAALWGEALRLLDMARTGRLP